MITFLISIVALVLGYFIYGSWVDRKFGSDANRKTPAITENDGVDFIPMKNGKIFLIQFLNIAGLGPIFGAIAGALWGPVAFVWIVVGAIFAGGVHDYFSGMLSIRHKGASIPEIVGQYLGSGIKNFMRFFAVILLILVGVVFVKGPASILAPISGIKVSILVIAIFSYYFLATLIPVDKLIGKIYPVFGLTLLIMAIGIFLMILFNGLPVPDLTLGNLKNMHSNPSEYPVFPLLFITIACGAISGFHSTQSPLMARCLKNEQDGKKIFFGAMIAEGIVALIWAAVAMSFFGGVKELGAVMEVEGQNAAWVVNEICNSLLGKIGGLLAIIGVVVAPISSGDTAFRSARLTISDSFNLKQDKLVKRLLITIPLFAIGIALTNIDFGIVWRYFGWANQTLATIVLWTATVYMLKMHKNFLFLLIPSVFMSFIVLSYILIAPEGFQLDKTIAYILSIIGTIILTAIFFFSFSSHIKKQQRGDIKSNINKINSK
ncbi:carbon starvation protein A [uncultured Draconibacterium sp.]|uniref:carbon starvation CstA family protein n=1 Tax=uncultured Draconibacterium sp. TaxID=1573823 RepID=UPI0025DDE3CC|nr:carbon starvation protein A [uncultured Draconibacterium sp.]